MVPERQAVLGLVQLDGGTDQFRSLPRRLRWRRLDVKEINAWQIAEELKYICNIMLAEIYFLPAFICRLIYLRAYEEQMCTTAAKKQQKQTNKQTKKPQLCKGPNSFVLRSQVQSLQYSMVFRSGNEESRMHSPLSQNIHVSKNKDVLRSIALSAYYTLRAACWTRSLLPLQNNALTTLFH